LFRLSEGAVETVSIALAIAALLAGLGPVIGSDVLAVHASPLRSSGLIYAIAVPVAGISAGGIAFIGAVPAPFPFSGFDTIIVAFPSSFSVAYFGSIP